MITNTLNFCQLQPTLCCDFFPTDISWENTVFFDIETTGLSPKNSRVYLIGALFSDGHTPSLIQFFAEEESEEEESAILQAFSDLIKNKKYVVHFNGTVFDVPYLQSRYAHYDLPCPLSDLFQQDLYRKLKDLRFFFSQMSSHRQKSYEELLSFPRKDRLSGKELIKVYQFYQKEKDPTAFEAILLHNSDDLKGMIALLSFSGLFQILQGNYSLENLEEIEEADYQGQARRALLLTFSFPEEIPFQLSAPTPWGYFTLQKNHFKLKAPIYQGTLKLFYPDYKNYYYLPFEDEAIHKSVGMFLDASRRKKATASTCYQKITGYFLPAPQESTLPLCREEFRAKENYTPYPFQDPANHPISYAKGIFQHLMKS